MSNVRTASPTCRACGEPIRERSLICARCGVSVKPIRAKANLILLVPGIILFVLLLVMTAIIASGFRG